MSIGGTLAMGMTEIRGSNLSLVAAFGPTDAGHDVLVPLVDWQLFGRKFADQEDPPPSSPGRVLSSGMLTLDNLAFLLQDIGYDMREAVRLLTAQSWSGIRPLPSRMLYTENMLRAAAAHLADAANQIAEDRARHAATADATHEPPADPD